MKYDVFINRRKRKIRENSKKAMVITCSIIIGILLFILAFFVTVFVIHRQSTNHEIEIMNDAGLYNLVNIDNDKQLNIAIYGNPEGKHKFVTISDIDTHNFTVFARHMALKISKDHSIALVDRPGHGFSQDTLDERDLETIVEEYRASLSEEGYEAPYILLSDRFGGTYATYWASKYPEEVEGIIYINGDTEYNVETEIPTVQEVHFNSILFKTGLQRLLYMKYFDLSSKHLTIEEVDLARACNVHNFMSMASSNEKKNKEFNYNQVFDDLEPNDIPKVYVTSKYGFQTNKDVIKFFEYKNEMNDLKGLDLYYEFLDEESTKQDTDLIIKESKEHIETDIKDFARKVGGCMITSIPGDEIIYEQNPEAIAYLMKDFITYLDGDKEAIKIRYDDLNMINWEEQAEQKKELEKEKEKQREESKKEETKEETINQE